MNNIEFGPRHYIPILKVKRGEKRALTQLSLQVRQYVVPLMEIVERTNNKQLNEHLDTAFRDLASSLRGYSRCFIDVRELEPDGQLAAMDVFRRASIAGMPYTPVTGISRTADVGPAVALSPTNGVALRLTRQEFESGQLPSQLNRFISSHGLHPEGVDLIVDLGGLEDLISPGVIALAGAFLATVPNQAAWRTLTVSGSSFPRSMSVVGRNSSARIARTEWLAWRDGLFRRRTSLHRLPTFSDCAIQHPSGVENFDPTYMQVSATVRYALDDAWLLIKGESTRFNPARSQFPVLATQLAYGPFINDFQGSGHCQGCRMIEGAANGGSRLGSAEVWRRIGTIHHITTVVQNGLGGLPWP